MAQRKSAIDQRAENRSKETLKRKNLSKRMVKESIDFDQIIASSDPQAVFSDMWKQLDKKLSENKHFQGYLGYEPPRLYRRVIYLSQAAMPDRVKLS